MKELTELLLEYVDQDDLIDYLMDNQETLSEFLDICKTKSVYQSLPIIIDIEDKLIEKLTHANICYICQHEIEYVKTYKETEIEPEGYVRKCSNCGKVYE